MNNMCMGSEKGKLSLKSELLLGALAMVLIVGLTGVHAASAKAKDADDAPSGQMFDPFTLQSLSGTESQILSLGLNNAPQRIHIPSRPVCRSPFRPIWTPPGPPPWAPGPPPWAPGPPH